nr:hypothetical protein [Tanacetum cinerariifolium]
MARLQLCDYHNMVAILEKGKHNVDFHPMVNFIEASPLWYALTAKPTVYVSHIRQFWSTARIETAEEGTKILATGEGSATPTEPHHTPSPEAQPSSHAHISSPTLPTVTHIPTVTPIDTPIIRQYTRRTRIAQSFIRPPVADEPASPLRDISQGEAYPTDSAFIADQDMATIAKSSTLPHDSAPRVTSSATVEGSMQQSIPELTALCTSLQRQLSELTDKFQAQEVEINRLKERVKLLEEREGVAATNSRDDAPIKGMSMDEGEAATERVSDDTKEIATVLTSMDAATILASRVVDVPTGSGSIPTASTPAEGSVPTGNEEVPTASPVFATATMVARELEEQLAREDQRRAEQIARDAEIARIHAKEELQIIINGLDRNNKTIAKYLEEYQQFSSELPMERRIELISDLVKYQDNYAKIYKFQSQQRKSWTKKQKRVYYMAVIRNNIGWKMEDFIPMGSKEEAERIKRKGINLEQGSAKKQKTLEEVTEEERPPKEVIEEKVHSEGQRSYWKITRLGGSSASYQFFIDLLKHLDREDLNQLWRLVKETLCNRPPTSDKEMELWVELNRVYELDKEDQLWTHTQNFMHAPVDWKLYDSCGVHHVTSKDKEIFMLVEKDYPLRKGSGSCNDLLQASSGELLTDGK